MWESQSGGELGAHECMPQCPIKFTLASSSMWQRSANACLHSDSASQIPTPAVYVAIDIDENDDVAINNDYGRDVHNNI